MDFNDPQARLELVRKLLAQYAVYDPKNKLGFRRWRQLQQLAGKLEREVARAKD